jgi:hypothetical protein
LLIIVLFLDYRVFCTFLINTTTLKAIRRIWMAHFDLEGSSGIIENYSTLPKRNLLKINGKNFVEIDRKASEIVESILRQQKRGLDQGGGCLALYNMVSRECHRSTICFPLKRTDMLQKENDVEISMATRRQKTKNGTTIMNQWIICFSGFGKTEKNLLVTNGLAKYLAS